MPGDSNFVQRMTWDLYFSTHVDVNFFLVVMVPWEQIALIRIVYSRQAVQNRSSGVIER